MRPAKVGFQQVKPCTSVGAIVFLLFIFLFLLLLRQRESHSGFLISKIRVTIGAAAGTGQYSKAALGLLTPQEGSSYGVGPWDLLLG